MNEHEIRFPEHYKPLPAGFKVIWSEGCEMFLGICEEKDIESPVFCCKYMARRWCFAFADYLNHQMEVPSETGKTYNITDKICN